MSYGDELERTYQARQKMKSEAHEVVADALPKVRPHLTEEEYGALCALLFIDLDWKPTEEEMFAQRARLLDQGLIDAAGNWVGRPSRRPTGGPTP